MSKNVTNEEKLISDINQRKMNEPYEKLNNKKVIAVPIEIESSFELYHIVKDFILEYKHTSFEEWVNTCYIERMQQILNDPTEFGKLMLYPVKSAHCINHNYNEINQGCENIPNGGD